MIGDGLFVCMECTNRLYNSLIHMFLMPHSGFKLHILPIDKLQSVTYTYTHRTIGQLIWTNNGVGFYLKMILVGIVQSDLVMLSFRPPH